MHVVDGFVDVEVAVGLRYVWQKSEYGYFHRSAIRASEELTVQSLVLTW